MSHPFGDLLTQYLHRKHGLSQAKLAAGILQAPSIISEMSQGKRLRGPQARERVTTIITWLQQQGALTTLDEANGLLNAAHMAPLQERASDEALIIRKLSTHAHPPPPHTASELRTSTHSPHTTPRHNLPPQLTPFIGRTAQIAHLVEQCQSQRLLTLTGAGGVGKTRLALEVATRLLAHFGDGVWFVDLAPLTEAPAIAQRILDLWRVPEQSERAPLALLTGYLRGKQLLLILDNCEHLIDACAALAETLLQQCPQLSLLATSREALNIQAERPWRVPSLTRPRANLGWGASAVAAQSPLTPDALFGFEAVALLLERAQRHQPGLTLTTVNAGAVAQICSRLDGIPLALEMAAARLNLFTVEELATRLDGAFDARFQLLTSGARTAPPRQQTLRATLEWSYGLLTAQEQCLLACLSVFSGGWTFAAAEAIASVEWGVGSGESDGVDSALRTPHSTLDLLAQLVNKSLVITDQQAGQTRYRLLETVRQFANAQLATNQQASTNLFTVAHQQHLCYYLALAEEIEPGLRVGPQVAQGYAQLEAEHDNLRAALTWALHSGELILAARIVAALYDFWAARGYLQEGRIQAERVLTQSAGMSATERGRLLLTAGGLAASQHNYEAAQPLLAESEALARPLGSAGHFTLARTCIEWGWAKAEFLDFAAAQRYGLEALALGQALADPWVCGEALIILGAIAREQGDYATARQHLDAAVACTQPLGCTPVYGNTLSNLGMLLVEQGDYLAAHARLGQSVAIFEQLGNRSALAWSLLGLGEIAAALDNVTQALQFYEQALAIQRALQDLDHASVTLLALGRLAQHQSDYPRSQALLYESLTITVAMGYRPQIADILEAIAALAATQRQTERAARLLGAVAALWQKDHLLPKPLRQAAHERMVATVREYLGEALFTRTWAEGAAMTLAQAVDYALAS